MFINTFLDLCVFDAVVRDFVLEIKRTERYRREVGRDEKRDEAQ